MSNWPKAKIIDAKKGIIKVTPKKKKVALVGTSSSRKLAPYDNSDWECWGLNEIDQERAERWFEIHELKASNRREKLWLKKCKQPIYMVKKYAQIPMAVRYPFEKVLSVPGARMYFTCTFAYQIALAIYEGFEEIGLYGVNLPTGSPRERTVERACTEWWLGLAEGKGIKIDIPEQDSICWHSYNYGFEYQQEINSVKRTMAGLFGRMCTDLYLKIEKEK
jgi:hypothetical protein